MGIYDAFRLAAAGVERVPWRWRLLAGASTGAVAGAMSGNEDMSFGERVTKGMALGAGVGLGSGMILRGAGGLVSEGAAIGKAQILGKAGQVRTQGIKALMKPGTLMLGGAIAGAAIAPEGSRTKGALIGGGVGLAFNPARRVLKGWNALGKVPGVQTGALLATSAVAVGAVGVFGNGAPEGGGSAVPGVGSTMDYEPLSGNMQDRMFAMNATGDIVLGLHGRQHG